MLTFTALEIILLIALLIFIGAGITYLCFRAEIFGENRSSQTELDLVKKDIEIASLKLIAANPVWSLPAFREGKGDWTEDMHMAWVAGNKLQEDIGGLLKASSGWGSLWNSEKVVAYLRDEYAIPHDQAFYLRTLVAQHAKVPIWEVDHAFVVVHFLELIRNPSESTQTNLH